MGPWLYNLLYRRGAPWDAVGVRGELRRLVTRGAVSPGTHPRAVDLGCGTGANVVFLAEQGFEVTGVDFSSVALDRARARASAAGVADRCRFLQRDLTAAGAGELGGPYDLIVDYGTLDDLRTGRRPRLARLIERLAAPGAVFLLWCFYGHRQELPWVAMGPNRLTPAIEPGEERALFAEAFEIERLPLEPDVPHAACFLLTSRSQAVV